MMSTLTPAKIKICGICSVEDAQLALKYKVQYLGLIFVKSSPRYVEPAIAKSIVKAINGKIQVVGVFQNSTLAEMENIAAAVGLDYFQLHGQESVDVCANLSKPVIKVFQIAREIANDDACITLPLFDLETKEESENYQSILEKYKPYCQHFLFDKSKRHTQHDPHNYDWLDFAISRLKVMEEHLPDYALAGGLNASNVQRILLELKPAILDIASGVETTARTKSENLIAEFCAKVQSLNNKAFVPKLEDK